jgi:hypothetical protein
MFVVLAARVKPQSPTTVFKSLDFVRRVKRDVRHGNMDHGEFAPGLYRSIGNVTYSILPRRQEPHLVKCFL